MTKDPRLAAYAKLKTEYQNKKWTPEEHVRLLTAIRAGFDAYTQARADLLDARKPTAKPTASPQPASRPALAPCPDCGHAVSRNAGACPNCGAPIVGAREALAAGAPLTTTQGTSKKLKAQTLLSALLFWSGAIWLVSATMAAPDAGSAEVSSTPSFMVALGLIWYIATRFRIWWHHK